MTKLNFIPTIYQDCKQFRFTNAFCGLLQWRNRLARRTYKQYNASHAEVVSSSLTWSMYFSHIKNTISITEFATKNNLPRVRIELTTFRFLFGQFGLWDWRAAYCATEAVVLYRCSWNSVSWLVFVCDDIKYHQSMWSVVQQSGAVEACWAHNPEVRRSKLRSAIYIFFHCYKGNYWFW